MATAYIGLGANIDGPAGGPEATLAAAAKRLGQHGRVAARSSLYSTAPVGMKDQPRFLNVVVALETELAPHALLQVLLDVEREFGRDRSASVRNGPRTLDLDMLLYGDLVLSEHDLEVPHPRLAERAFVLVPLDEIAPELREPRSGATVSQLMVKLSPEPESDANAVVRVEGDVWRAGSNGGERNAAARAGSAGDLSNG